MRNCVMWANDEQMARELASRLVLQPQALPGHVTDAELPAPQKGHTGIGLMLMRREPLVRIVSCCCPQSLFAVAATGMSD
jgi:hypothetical protein